MISAIILQQSFSLNLSKDEIKAKIYEMQKVAVKSEDIFYDQYDRNNSFDLLYCHARDTAVDLYSKHTYLPKEDTILHLKEMRKIIHQCRIQANFGVMKLHNQLVEAQPK